MKRDDAEEYTQALGQVVAGGWRQIALADRLGVPKALGLSLDQWVQQRIGGYVQLSVEERRKAAAELVAEGHSQRQIAGVLGVSKDTVGRDLAAVSNAPELVEIPSEGVSNAPLDVLSHLAATDEVRETAQRLDAREARDCAREKVKAERPAVPLPVGIFRLLYSDPPWRYEHVKTESRAIENQYPIMELDDICRVQVPAADDAVLFLWATSPKLAEAMRVVDSWGFTYRTCAVWDKEVIGMGYYFRQQHELLLVATRGERAPVPEPSTRLPSVFRSKRAEHSEKPTFVYGYLEAMYPQFGESDRVELFGRERRAGWTLWTNEPAEVLA